MKSIGKQRLDLILFEKGYAESRHKAQSLIMSGKVYVNGQLVDKAGTKIFSDSELIVKQSEFPFVSRGALKLEKAIQTFKVKVENLVCLDVGASTGGFTDCLLQYGAKKVYAVDVGYGQLVWKLRQDSRVEVIERTNIRHMDGDKIPEKVDLVTIDTSFISLKIVVPSSLKFIKEKGQILALIKPQFEVGKGKVGKGGIVRDPDQHQQVIRELSESFSNIGLICEDVVESPILGQKGNREFIISLKVAHESHTKNNPY